MANNLLNVDQFRKLSEYVPRLPAVLSALGSGIIIYFIMRDRLKHRKFVRPTYRRLLLALSILDVFYSIAFLMGRVMIPKGWLLGFGNTVTCTVQGVFIAVGALATCFYNACMMLYFLMTIRYGVSEAVMAKRYEPIFQGVSLLIPLAVALAGVWAQVFNPAVIIFESFEYYLEESPDTYLGWLNGTVSHEEFGAIPAYCFVNASPPHCENSKELVPCDRGGLAGLFSLGMTLPFFICFMTLVVCIVMIYRTVQQKEKASQQFVFEATTKLERRKRRKKSKMTRMVQQQALLYGFFFINTFVWFILWFVFFTNWIYIMFVCFMSSQGLFNFLIFIRPKIQQQRQRMDTSFFTSEASTIVGRILSSARRRTDSSMYMPSMQSTHSVRSMSERPTSRRSFFKFGKRSQLSPKSCHERFVHSEIDLTEKSPKQNEVPSNPHTAATAEGTSKGSDEINTNIVKNETLPVQVCDVSTIQQMVMDDSSVTSSPDYDHTESGTEMIGSSSTRVYDYDDPDGYETSHEF